MAFKYADRVRETSTSTGTGTFSLAGAVTGFQTFLAGIGASNTCMYTISHRTASEWEVGYGTLDLAGTTLTRTSVQASSSLGSAVTFSAGTKDVFVTLPASIFNVDNYPCQGRLTLTSGTPVTTSDVTAAGTVYFTPYLGTVIALYNTTTGLWDKFNFSQLSASLALYGGDTNIDFFVYNNAGTPALFLATWSSNTARATALTTQNGILVASGSPQYRYVGTVRTTVTAAQTEDSHSLRLVWNQYNRVVKALRRAEPTASWTYGGAGSTVTRYQFNSSSNRVDVVCGESQAVFVKFFCDSSRNAAGTSFMGINYQTTNIFGAPGGSTVVLNSCGSNASVLNLIQSTSCAYSIQLPIGYASFGAVEWNNATTFTTTSYGSTRSGLHGTWPC